MLTATAVEYRWMFEEHVEALCFIERESFPTPWTYLEFTRFLQVPHNNGYIAVQRESRTRRRIVGYLLWSCEPDCVRIVSMAVAPKFRRQGIGTGLLETLYSKRTVRTVPHIADVWERNEQAAKFFAAKGYSSELVRDYFNDHSDAYRFTLRLVREVGYGGAR